MEIGRIAKGLKITTTEHKLGGPAGLLVHGFNVRIDLVQFTVKTAHNTHSHHDDYLVGTVMSNGSIESIAIKRKPLALRPKWDECAFNAFKVSEVVCTPVAHTQRRCKGRNAGRESNPESSSIEPPQPSTESGYSYGAGGEKLLGCIFRCDL